MKRLLLILLVAALVGGGYLWIKRGRAVQTASAEKTSTEAKSPAGAAPAGHETEKPAGEKPSAEKPAGEKPAGDEPAENRVSRDENGNSVVKMDHKTQETAGLKTAHPAAASLPPEVKGYGRVVDPAPLAALLAELAADRAAYPASSNELVRLRTLTGQGNASTRALQAAEAAAIHDELAIRSASRRLALTWGETLAGRANSPSFIDSLASLKTALVRVDLPPGQLLESPPLAARLTTLSGAMVEASFAGQAPDTDPLTQGRGFYFLVGDNTGGLVPGQALVGYLKVPGEPLAGVLVPREAVVRAEGAAWVYLLNTGGESFTRLRVELDHPVDSGWLVAKGLKAGDSIVVAGAQTLLSEELKSMLSAD